MVNCFYPLENSLLSPASVVSLLCVTADLLNGTVIVLNCVELIRYLIRLGIFFNYQNLAVAISAV